MYALYFFTRIFTINKTGKKTGVRIPVSIVICAKNEAHNLVKNLPEILSQKYHDGKKPLYEVLVVNDASDDDTENVLHELQNQHTHLKYINISPTEPRTFKGKKFALSKAVDAVQYENILMTDADCLPSSDKWLSLMTEPLQHRKEIVCGYGAYKIEPGFLNTFIRWETLHTFLQYSSYASAGIPYMGVGRNIACKKQTLLKAQQSSIWNELPSGDDDLLVQVCGTRKNVSIVSQKNAFTYSEAKRSWQDWLLQKQRHASTGKYYKKITKQLLGIYALAHGLGWLLFFVLMFFSDWALIFLLFMMRCGIYWVIWEATATKMNERKLLRWMPVCDFGWAVYNFALSPYIFFKNKQQWK